MGPAFATLDEIPDPQDVKFRLTLNGEVMQDGSTGDIIFGIADILSYFSYWHMFMPGDVITTGSPPGVGFTRNPPRFLRPGDEVSITCDGLGTLTNPVAAGK